jgi:hypothetical protein
VSPGPARGPQAGLPPRSGLRLARLHLASRRAPATLVAVITSAVVLRIALQLDWDAYGARQLPLIFETACAATIATATASPFGEPERVTGQRLPLLRLGAALTSTAAAAAALAAAGIGTNLAGGTVEVLRNTAGLTGIGLLCAAVLGGSRAWIGPLAYLLIAAYALYTQWHGPALSTPWIWPARPTHDVGAGICAGLVFVAGLVAVTARGAGDPVGE